MKVFDCEVYTKPFAQNFTLQWTGKHPDSSHGDPFEVLHLPFDVNRRSLPGLTFRSDMLWMGLVGTKGLGWKPRNADTQCALAVVCILRVNDSISVWAGPGSHYKQTTVRYSSSAQRNLNRQRGSKDGFCDFRVTPSRWNTYKPSTQNGADSMSGGNDAEDSICFVAKKWIPKATTAREIEVAAAANHRIWFGQSKLYFILNWLVMRCKHRPELAADAQQTAWSKM